MWWNNTAWPVSACRNTSAGSNGRQIVESPTPRPPSLQTHLGDVVPESRRATPRGCAGLEYPDLVAGVYDFLIYWRTLSWDHAPGVLFATEAGLTATTPDGSTYTPAGTGSGLLVAHPQIAGPLADTVWRGVPIDIRDATPVDQAQVGACVDAAYRHYINRMGKPPAPMLADYESLIATGRVRVASSAGKIAGVIAAWAESDHYYIDNVAVDPAHQGRGIGAALLDDAERAARTVGFRELRLYTNASMTGNLTYYPRLGFTETHRACDEGYDRVYFTKPVRP